MKPKKIIEVSSLKIKTIAMEFAKLGMTGIDPNKKNYEVPSPIGQNSATTNHVSFKNVLKKMVQQVLGSCYKKNKHVYLITDEIDTNAIAEWKNNFKVMNKVCETVNVIYFTKKGDYHNVNNLFGI